MNFGGGFEANASQFNGGGFMPSPGAQAGGGSAQKKAYDQSSQSVRKVTIRQLYTGLEQSASDAVIVDGKEVSNVSFGLQPKIYRRTANLDSFSLVANRFTVL